MSAWPGLRRVFRLPRTLASIEGEIDEELRHHLEARAAELEGTGVSPAVARERALREFGSLAEARDELAQIGQRRLRRVRRAEGWTTFAHDLRYAVRALRLRAVFSAGVVLTLALAIGANAMVFGLVDRLLLSPPPGVHGADGLVRLYFTQTFDWSGTFTQAYASYPDYAALRDGARSFQGTAAVWAGEATLGEREGARRIRRGLTTASLFPLLGVEPALGRFFTEEEAGEGPGARVVVLSHGLWRGAFGGRRDVLGQSVRVNHQPYEIIGVAPAGFGGVDLRPVDLWVPVPAVGAEVVGDDWRQAVSSTWVNVVARLAPGVTRAAAGAEATVLFRRLHVEATAGGRSASAGGIAGMFHDPTARVTAGPLVSARGPVENAETRSVSFSLWLSAVSAILLLIACANVANLQLARAFQRRKEIAVRLALGVTGSRLTGQLLLESAVLAVAGGALGLGLASWGGSLLRSVLLPEGGWSRGALDARVLAFTALLVMVTALATGLAPALQSRHPDLLSELKSSSADRGSRRRGVRSGLVVAQAALSVLLLFGAGLFVRSLFNLRALPMGFEAGRVLVVTLELSPGDRTLDEVDRVHQAALRAVLHVQGVERAGIATAVPFHSSMSTSLHVPGVDSLPVGSDGGPYIVGVSPDLISTLGTPIVRGRGVLESDGEGAPRVAVVSETMARALWGDADPLGRCLHVGGRDQPCSRVAGVAADARRQSIGEDRVLQYYVPLAQRQTRTADRALLARAVGDDPESLVEAIRRAAHEADPTVAFANVLPLQTLIDPSLRPWRLAATVFAVYGLLAMLIAGMGLYSLVAFTVAQRLHEMGVRLALGAEASGVLRLVVAEGVRLTAGGVALGLAAALLASEAVAGILFRVSPRDPAVLATVATVLLAVGLAASLPPAIRAARLDPVRVLRAE